MLFNRDLLEKSINDFGLSKKDQDFLQEKNLSLISLLFLIPKREYIIQINGLEGSFSLINLKTKWAAFVYLKSFSQIGFRGQITKALFKTKNGTLVNTMWIKQPYILKKLKGLTSCYLVFEKFEIKDNNMVIFFPTIMEKINEMNISYYDYSSLENKKLQNIISSFLNLCFQKKLINLPVYNIMYNIHFSSDVLLYKQSLKKLLHFKPLLIYCAVRKEVEDFDVDISKHYSLIEKIFNIELYENQKTVAKKLFVALKQKKNCLLFGEVASGKTFVIITLISLFLEEGATVGVLSPTRILSQQNSIKIEKMFPKEIAEKKLIVGTHGILTEKKDFDLLIIDEEQKFGSELKNRYDYLTLRLSATPMPKTLHEALFEKIHVEYLEHELKNIHTLLIAYSDDSLISYVQKYPKVLVIAPKIADIKKILIILQEYQPLVLHGKLSAEEQKEVFSIFRDKEKGICLATSIVEIGIDIVDLDAVIITGAQHFGISQLHQMRGRVGRGQKPGYCIIMFPGDININTFDRLKLFQNTLSGLNLALFDKERRGPGEILSNKQSGKKKNSISIDFKFLQEIYLSLTPEKRKKYAELCEFLLDKLKDEF